MFCVEVEDDSDDDIREEVDSSLKCWIVMDELEVNGNEVDDDKEWGDVGSGIDI